MADLTLKSLHTYLKVLENASELKRRLPASFSPRTLKEELSEMSKLTDVDDAVFKDAQTVAALIGAQRFVMIWGEPSVNGDRTRPNAEGATCKMHSFKNWRMASCLITTKAQTCGFIFGRLPKVS